MSRHLMLLFLLMLAPADLMAEEPTPLARAQAAFEEARSDEHRERMRLTWDESEPPMPESLDVFVLRGYLNHDLLLLQWRNGQVTGHVAKVDRQWFYHRGPNARSYATVTLTANEFVTMWRTIRHLISVQASEIKPPTEEQRGWRSIRSSHQSSHLLTWGISPPTVWASLPVVSGTNIKDGIRDLDELRMSAITDLVWERFPKESWIADPEQCSAPHWHAWWRSVLPGCQGDGTSEVTARNRLLIDNACEMLGDLGDATDADLLTKLARSLRPPQPREDGVPTSPTYWEDSLRAKILRCTERITLRQNWDSTAATRSIHGNDGRTHADNDQERWLRERFHQRDPARYHALLLEDIQVGGSDLVVRSIKEVLSRYPGQHQDVLLRLLQRDDPAVVAASAFGLLGKEATTYGWQVDKELTALCIRAEQELTLHAALTALQRLASDPTVKMPANAHWFELTPRVSALEFLGACPPPWGWDRDRCHRQLNDPMETDARIIAQLLPGVGLSRLHEVTPPPTISETDRAMLVTIWRRCLSMPYTRGTILAVEELIALRDIESLPRLQQVVRDLLDGAASPLAGGQPRLPWLSKYSLEKVEQGLQQLTSEAPAP